MSPDAMTDLIGGTTATLMLGGRGFADGDRVSSVSISGQPASPR